jgi:hypothetical protein
LCGGQCRPNLTSEADAGGRARYSYRLRLDAESRRATKQKYFTHSVLIGGKNAVMSETLC